MTDQRIVVAPSRKALTVGRMGRFEFLKAGELQIDRRYQRALNYERVDDLIAEWDDDAFGILLVSRRRPGEDFLIDGQHRNAGVIKMGRGDDEVPCYVYDGFTLEEEADVFWRINKRRLQPSHPDTFRARLTAKEPVAVEIMAIFESHFINPSWYPKYLAANEIYAFGAVEYLYDMGDLDWILGVLREGWPQIAGALRSDRLLGMGRFLSQWRDFFDDRTMLARTRREFLVKRLSDNPPAVIIERGLNYRLTLHTRPHTAFARAIHEVYNANLRNNPVKLPAWAPGERRVPRRTVTDDRPLSGEGGEGEPNPSRFHPVRPKTKAKPKTTAARGPYEEYVR